MSGSGSPGIEVTLLGTAVDLQNLMRDVLLVGVILVSLRMTPPTAHLRKRIFVGADAGSGEAFCRHFHHDYSGDCHAEAGEAGPFAPSCPA